MSETTNLADLLTLAFGSEWRPWPASPEYHFSRDGRAARMKQTKRGLSAILLIGCEAGRHYRAISTPQRVYIHRAVCELFNWPPKPGEHARHLDCDTRNNNAANLAWGTPQQNSDDGVRNNRYRKGAANPMARLTADDVAQMRAMRATTGAYYSQIAERYGVSTMTAFRAVRGESWK